MEAPTIPTCKHALLVIGLLTAPTAALADTGGLSAYLKARAADADGRVTIAADQYALALAAAPDDPVGPDPVNVDTAEANAAAPDIFAPTVLLLASRIQPIARNDVKSAVSAGFRCPTGSPDRPK